MADEKKMEAHRGDKHAYQTSMTVEVNTELHEAVAAILGGGKSRAHQNGAFASGSVVLDESRRAGAPWFWRAPPNTRDMENDVSYMPNTTDVVLPSSHNLASKYRKVKFQL